MKRIPFLSSVSMVILTMVISGVMSCSTDAESQTDQLDSQLSAVELQTILETDRWTGAADEILTQLYLNSQIPSGKFADEQCYQATYSETGFRVVFGNCLLNGTDNVNGTLEVAYLSRAGATSFTVVFSGFFVGTIELNGKRTITLSETGEIGFRFSVVSDMTVMLSDEESIRENGFKSIDFQFGDTLSGSNYTITGDWTIQIGENQYTVFAESPLYGTLGCPYLISGVLDVNKDGKAMSVDFGDGTCDGDITVIYPNGVIRDMSL